jgi:DNA invertase Pin-like site-specific DNA recombinase
MRARWTREKRDLRNLTGLRFGLYARASHDPTGRGKSVTDQMTVGRRDIEGLGGVVAGEYDRDNDRSASRYGTKAREDFERLLADIEAGKLDGVWFWDLSRSQRRLDVYVKLRDLCRDKGVLWLIGGRAYDLSNYMDLQALGFDAINNEVFSERLSANVCRGKASNAKEGRPLGRNTYGYVRVYDPRTRELVEIKRDEEPRTATGTDGTVTVYCPAGIVRELFKEFAAGASLKSLAHSLQDRGIPTSSSAQRWWLSTVRSILSNPAYVAKVVHRGEILDTVEAMWPPISDDPKFGETYHAVQGVLSDSSRRTNREARARHPLGSILKCGYCGGPMSGRAHKGGRLSRYECTVRACTSVTYDTVNDFVQGKIIAWLSDPEVHKHLTRRERDASGEATQARAEAERLRGERETWRQLSESGQADAITANRSINGLTEKIDALDKRAEELTTPPVLRGVLGENAAQEWTRLDFEVKRKVIRAIAEIKVIAPARERRIQWRWRLGPDEPQWHDLELPLPLEATPEGRDALAVQRAREIFADELASGNIPSPTKIQTLVQVTWYRAKRVRAALAAAQEGDDVQQ